MKSGSSSMKPNSALPDEIRFELIELGPAR